MELAYSQQQQNKQVHLVSHKDILAILAEEHGPRFVEYRRQWDASMRLEAHPDFPLTVEIETNNHCNYRCNMCVFASATLHPDVRRGVGKKFMDFGLFRKVMDEGAAHGLPALTYGFMSEPLLHPRIVDMVALATDRGVMDQRLGSNGSLLTRDISRGVIAGGLARLEISVDATLPETYAKIRKGGNLDKINRAIHEFLEERDKANRRLPLLRVSFLRLNVNSHELDDFMAAWEPYADYFSIQEPIDYELDIADSALHFDPAQDKVDFSCDKQFQRLFLRWDGTVLACGHIHGWEEFRLGNAAEQSLHSMWRSELMESLRALHRRKGYAENPICRYCVRQTMVPAAKEGATRP